MTTFASQSAQLNLPPGGSASYACVDWARGRIYLYRNSTIYSFAATMETQSPIGSTTLTFGIQALDIDPLTGNIICQPGGYNAAPIYKFDQTSFAQLATWGSFGSFPSYPSSLVVAQQIICVQAGTVSYAVMKSFISDTLSVVRVDTLAPAGFQMSTICKAHVMCRGTSGAAGGAVYLASDPAANSDGTPAYLTVQSVTILPAASAYNISSWPTQNPAITTALIASIPVATIDPTWTYVSASAIGYDAMDGNVIVAVGTTGPGGRLVKVDVATGAILWNIINPSPAIALNNFSIVGGGLPVVDSTGALIIDTMAGTTATVTDNASGVGVASSDQLALVVVYGSVAGSPNPTPVSGTPSSFGPAWFLLSGVYTPPQKVIVADLWFSPTAAFVDLTVVSNRRRFISEVGAAQNLGADGSAPFQVAPPVFLTSNGTPSSFAADNGRGGPFTVSAGTLAAGPSNPPQASETTVTFVTGSPGNGVLGDYRTGNLYAFNPATLTDNGTQRRWVRRWRAVAGNSPAAKRFASLVINMQTGQGVPAGTKPQVMLRWSDDGGRTWSEQRFQPVGELGATTQSVKFNRLGMTRRFGGSDRYFELSSSDPFAVAIIDAEVDVS